jgi:uncharacterized protein YkwD
MSDLSELGDFEQLEEIGRGGFAVVYRAFQPRFGRTVAIKVLDPGADALSLERFERECEAMGMLSSHPNIVTIFDAGVSEGGAPYLVMEHMPGGTLDDRLEAEGPFDAAEVLEVGVKLAGALQTAHGAAVLHRDVKPANVLVSPFGEPCLSDFGLARFGGSAKTTGVVTATLLHAPPEILAGEPATPRSDVYSLGSALYTLAAGNAPFWTETDESILPLIGRISHEPVPDLRADLPDPVCAALERAMSKEAADRHQSAAELGEDLRSAQEALGLPVTPMRLAGDESVRAARRLVAPTEDTDATIRRTPVKTAESAPPPPPTEMPRRRRRWPLVAAVVLVVAVVGGILAFALGRGDDGGGSGNGDVATDASDDGATDDAEQPTVRQARAQTTELINDYRQENGRAELPVDRQLVELAQRHAEEAARTGDFPSLTTDEAREEIERDHPNRWSFIATADIQGDSVEDAFQNAVESASTRESLLRADVDVVGVGVAYSESGDVVYLVQYLANAL